MCQCLVPSFHHAYVHVSTKYTVKIQSSANVPRIPDITMYSHAPPPDPTEYPHH